METFTVELVFNESSGDVKIFVSHADSSMSAMEINGAVMDGSLREKVIARIESLFGSEMAGLVRSGAIDMTCTDRHPDPDYPVASAGSTEGLEAPMRCPGRADDQTTFTKPGVSIGGPGLLSGSGRGLI